MGLFLFEINKQSEGFVATGCASIQSMAARWYFIPIFPPDDQGPRKLNEEVAQPLRVLAEGHHRIVVDTGRLEMEGRKLSLRRQQCE